MVGSDRFTNRRILATGGMATIYRAEDTRTGEDVVIKEILVQPTLTERAKSQMESRLRREAKTLVKLDHPNIVRCYGLIEDECSPYLITEFLDGVTLEQEILSKRIIGNKTRILDVFTQVCAGLEYARHLGLVHRDIKPGNIILCHSGVVKIIDFGIARERGGHGLTVDGQVLGTPHFMSPEQAAGGRNIDFRSDIFSLASCVYFCASGALPFDGENHFAVEDAVRLNQPPRGNIWPELEPVLDRAHSKNPSERHSSFASFAQDLQRALGPQKQPIEGSAGTESRDMPVHDAATPTPPSAPSSSSADSQHSLVTAALGYGCLLGLVVAVSGSTVVGLALVALCGLGLVLRTAGVSSSSTFHPMAPAELPQTAPVPAAPKEYVAPLPAPEPLSPPAQGFSPPAQAQAKSPAKRLRFTINGVPGESKPSNPGVFVIGRDPSCHVCIPGDSRVSGRHVTLTILAQGGLQITDHSSNGTFVGGTRVGTAAVPFGSRFRIGTTEIIIDGAYSAT